MGTITRAGVYGYNLPPKVGASVSPASFNIFGMIGRFARGFDDVIEVNNNGQAITRLGSYKSGYYGQYVLQNMFKNLRGQPAKGYIKTYVANDAVQAFKNAVDGSAVNTLKIKAAWRTKADKSADGNSTAYTLTLGARFSTTTSDTAILGATSITLTSVSGIRVGDYLRITSTGPVTHYAKVSALNEATRVVTITALTNAVGNNDVVEAMGFKIVTYRQDSRGVLSKLVIPENDQWLSMEPENTEFYVNNAFANHDYLALEDLASVTSGFGSWPVAVSTPTLLTSGSDGTSPASASDWDLYSEFDQYPIRFLCNTDTTLKAVNDAGESYCNGRLDTPQWVYNLATVANIDSLITAGNGYQRSDQVAGGIVYGWRNVVDPIGVGANPVLRVPVVGAVIGAWIRTFYTLGFHRSPAGDDVTIDGFTDTDTWEDLLTQVQLADLQNAGVNVMQKLSGRGLAIQSFITPSTNSAFLFWKWNLMQNFVKISATESLHPAINRPNRISALKSYGDAIKDFGLKLFQGSFPFGIDTENGAFGQYFKEDGSVSTFDDVFQVQVDQFNNPNANIVNGQGSINVYAYFNPDLRELGIGVGFIIPV